MPEKFEQHRRFPRKRLSRGQQNGQLSPYSPQGVAKKYIMNFIFCAWLFTI
jgi:hypothetical protein